MKLWKFLVLSAGLAAAGFLVLVMLHLEVVPRLVHRRQVVTTPDVRYLSLEVAKERLSAQGLAIQSTRERSHPTVPAGSVLDQTPAPGSPLRSGRSLKVVVSSGPEAGGVPDLAGLSRRQAELTLQRESFKLGRVVRIREAGRGDAVIVAQNPPAGRSVERGRKVDVVVAEPAPRLTLRMPDLRGQPLYRAEQAVTSAGCEMAPVSWERGDDEPAETVLEQTPPPGQRIEKGARIALVVVKR